MKFRKKPVIIEATQWFRMGDHPNVIGSINEPDSWCMVCSKPYHRHGWIHTLEGGYIVCPGDWIITGIRGECYPCKPDIFELTYEPYAEVN
jgi:hypothetical protein